MVFEVSSGLLVMHRFPQRLFGDIIDIKFEYRIYNTFAGYNEYPIQTFDDDMTPHRQRNKSHTIVSVPTGNSTFITNAYTPTREAADATSRVGV